MAAGPDPQRADLGPPLGLASTVAQTFLLEYLEGKPMDQVRDLRLLTGAEQPAFQYIAIPGCAAPCRIEDFDRLATSRLVASRPTGSLTDQA
jgi:4-phytase/acid phosphatase